VTNPVLPEVAPQEDSGRPTTDNDDVCHDARLSTRDSLASRSVVVYRLQLRLFTAAAGFHREIFEVDR